MEEYFRVVEQFDSTLSSVIDSTLGLRCRSFGYPDCVLPQVALWGKGISFYTPIWHLTKEEELENLHNMQEKMHPGDAYYNNIININNKKKIIKRKIYSKYTKHLQDAQNSAERQKVIEDCARNLLYFVAQNDDPYNAVINQRCRQKKAE